MSVIKNLMVGIGILIVLALILSGIFVLLVYLGFSINLVYYNFASDFLIFESFIGKWSKIISFALLIISFIAALILFGFGIFIRTGLSILTITLVFLSLFITLGAIEIVELLMNSSDLAGKETLANYIKSIVYSAGTSSIWHWLSDILYDWE